MKTPWFLCGLTVLSILFFTSPAFAAGLTVTSSADAVNGNTSFPDNLIANPGPDGISLREAILACNNAPGPHTITFSQTLAGQAIKLVQSLPVIMRNQVTIAGFNGADGQPAVTVDAGGSATGGISVVASDFTVMRLRFAGINFGGSPAVKVRVGTLPDGRPVSTLIANIRIEENVFEGFGETENRNAIWMGSDEGASGVTFRNILILRNSFLRFKGEGDGIHIGNRGTNTVIEDVLIQDNNFSETTFPIELVSISSNNKFLNTRIMRNTFVNNIQPITLVTIWNEGTPQASGNTIQDTLISNNVFRDNENPSIAIEGGVNAGATSNAVLNTQIVNNLITGTRRFVVIGLTGGRNGASGNRIDEVRVINNTIAMNPIVDPGATAMGVSPNLDGLANSVTGVVVLNTIFWGNPGGDFTGLTPNQVRFCLTSQSGFTGVNGNISVDPKFVSPAQGDFHLRPGSPATDAGTSDNAPSTDLECHTRYDDPATPNIGAGTSQYYDIGAYEYGSSQTVRLTVIKEGIGNGTVTTNPVGNECGAEGSPVYNIGAIVTLTPTPGPGSVFAGWSGDPDCSDGVVTMTESKTCIATFSIQPLTVVSPNGGEIWAIGTAQTISWMTNLEIGKVTIMLSRDGGNTWERLFKKAKNKGAITWTIEGPATNKARIRISSKNEPSITDLSDMDFVIR